MIPFYSELHYFSSFPFHRFFNFFINLSFPFSAFTVVTVPVASVSMRTLKFGLCFFIYISVGR
jgi:hypothetical protein